MFSRKRRGDGQIRLFLTPVKTIPTRVKFSLIALQYWQVQQGLNVVEQWNGATDFVFFARRGEMASNRREDHEISMLSLHLIQNCMVYINTLMIQKVLARPRWQQAMTPRDYAALTPLIWSHVNPYGLF